MGPAKPALKKKIEPADFGIGAPPAPKQTPVFHVEQTAAQRRTARLRAQQKDDKKRNDAIFKARQEIATREAIRARVAAAAGLPDAKSPFAGVEKGKGPGAKKPQLTSDLTTKSRLAAGRSQLRTQGGLLTPAQRGRLAVAEKATATSRTPTFADRHQLPADLAKPAVHLSQRDRDEILGRAKPIRPARIGTPQAPAEAPSGTPETRAAGRNLYRNGQQGGFRSAGSILDAARDWDVGPRISGGLSPRNIAFDAANIGSGGFLGAVTRTGKALDATAEKLEGLRPQPRTGALAHAAAAPLSWLNEDAKAAAKGKPPTLQELSDVQRFGEYSLTAEARGTMAPLAEANGYNLKDMPLWNDPELIARAYGPKNTPSLTGLLRNFGADVGQQLALGSAARMYGDTIAQAVGDRSLTPIARLGGQYLEGYKNLLPFVGDRPWGEQVYQHPFIAPTAVMPFVKGGGNIIGKRVMRLPNTREVTMPTRKSAVEAGIKPEGSERVTLPASQHPAGRLVQVIQDRLIAKGEHPEERTAKEQLKGAVRNPAGEVAHQVGILPARAGHALEKRADKKVLSDAHMQARVVAGRDAHLALQNLLKTMTKLPWAKDLARNRRWATKERVFEQLAEHESMASTGTEAAAHFRQVAAEVELQANELRFNADESRAAGDHVSAAQFERAAKDADAVVKAQHKAVQFSEEAGPDILNKPGAAPLSDAMRRASRTAGDILERQGLMDEKGRLFGDLQRRASVVDKTEGPGTEKGGAEGTKAWQAVQVLKTTRAEHNAARAEYHGKPAEEIDDLAPSADVRSTEAQHHMGRSRLARKFQQVVEEKQRERQQRRTADAEFDPVQTAVDAGVDARKLRRVASETHTRLASVVEGRQRADDKFDPLLVGRIDSMKRAEQAAHAETTRAAVRRADNALQIARTRKAPPEKLGPLEDNLRAAVEAEEAFRPSKGLLDMERQLEKKALHNDMLGLDSRVVDQVIDATFPPVRGELTPQQRWMVKRVMQSEQDKFLPLDALHFVARNMEENAAAEFKAITGKDVGVAHRFDQASHGYTRALRAFRDSQHAEGRDPFHAHMHKPETDYGLQPVRVSTGKQFEEADYTRDMHFLFARDLQGLSRKAVAGKLFEEISHGPMVALKPPIGSEVPPGWLRVPKDMWENLSKVNKDREMERKLMEEWRKTGKRSHAGSLVEADEVLITRNLREFIETTLHRGDPEREISAMLEVTNHYRRWMLFTLPRTFVANFVGNPILAAMQGAGLRTLGESLWTLRKHPERILHTLQGRGPVSNVMENPNAKMSGWQNMWRHANTFAEDNGNLMVYLLHAKRAFKKEQGLHWFNRVGRMNEHYGKFLEDAAAGKNPDAAKWAAKSAEMFGDMYKARKHDDTLATAFLFHRWVSHMIHLTLWTMPTKYPGRTAFLQQTAVMADDYRKKHGIFPEWAAGMVPLWQTVEKAGSGLQKVSWAWSSVGVMPWATPGQSIDLGTPGQPKAPAQALLASNLSPFWRVPLEAGTAHRLDTFEPFKDYKGDEIGSGLNWKVLAQGVLANTPLVNTVFSRAGQSDDSIQVPGLGMMHPRWSKTGALDPSMRSPIAQGRGWLYDIALMLVAASGASIRPIDAEGLRTELSAEKTITYQKLQQTKRENKRLEREGIKSQELWDRDPAAWRKSKYNTDKP